MSTFLKSFAFGAVAAAWICAFGEPKSVALAVAGALGTAVVLALLAIAEEIRKAV